MAERGEPLDPRLPEARRHLERCAECQRFLQDERTLVARLKNLPSQEAPAHLRERVRTAIEAERSGRPSREAWEVDAASPEEGDPPPFAAAARSGQREPRHARRPTSGALATAAILVLGLAGGWLVAQAFGGPEEGGRIPGASPDARQAASAPIEGFVRQAVQEERLLTSDPTQVASFIWRELGLQFSPSSYEGFELVGVEICVWEEKRGAVVMYQRMGQVLYHFVLADDADVVRTEPRLSLAAPERWQGARPSVAVWAGDDREEALVGNLEPAALLALVRTARGQDRGVSS